MNIFEHSGKGILKRNKSSGWADELRGGRIPVPSVGLEVALPHRKSLRWYQRWGSGQGSLGIPLRSRATTRKSCYARNPYERQRGFCSPAPLGVSIARKGRITAGHCSLQESNYFCCSKRSPSHTQPSCHQSPVLW